MEIDKSILLQKQVKDNSSDLQSEFFDLKNWEEQMKRKDSELLYASGDQALPPIRSRKKSPIEKTEPKITKVDTKRIKSSDYASWEKFDVDKACKELDEQEDHEILDEELSKEELEKNHTQALEHKEKGNFFVKQQQWSQAIKSYDEAIKIFPYDAVFYANRALCHLKMDNLHSAEADCTAAVQLDELYVKAYHRRATIRKELKQYKEAMEDLEKVLKLDSTNKEANKMLAQINKKLKDSKPIVAPQTDDTDDKPIESKIGEKLFGGPIKKSPEVNKSSAPQKQRISSWVSGEGEDITIVQPIVKAPHQRSKKPLRRIEVKEIELGKSHKNSTLEKVTSSIKEVIHQQEVKPLIDEVSHKQEMERVKLEPTRSDVNEVPLIPKTTVQFFMSWKKNTDPQFRFNYLKQIPVDTIHEIFKDSMEPDTFSEILTILSTEFIKRKEPVFRYLKDLAEVKRFSALTMFMTAADKKALKTIFEYCKTSENISSDILALLQKKYEI